ncbi:MAG: hypothetical protein IT458_08925 [Planctomycetes bacterium]|nr:hypothetical protein [Planctomycetota bacterium]
MNPEIVRGWASFLILMTMGPLAAQEPGARPTTQPGPESRPADSDFLRFVAQGEDQGRMEVALPVYRNAAGVTVTLVSAVHIADAKHYADLVERFAAFDAVLYELVAKPEDRPEPGKPRAGGLLSMMQRALKNGLEMEFQLDAVDYAQANFVHADLTPQEFHRLQKERGESIIGLMFRAMQVEMARVRESGAGGQKPPDLVRAFRRGEGRHLLRLTLARQFHDMERLVAGFSPGKEGSVLVEGRNARALEVLDAEVGKGRKNVAIYYGAAHMPDMERRLLARGFVKTGETWLTAWDVTKRPR